MTVRSSSPPSVPRPPFAAWPVQRKVSVGFVWVSESPRAIITQALREEVDMQDVNHLHDVFDELVGCGFVSAEHDITVVHDWRAVLRAPRDVRAQWLDRASRPGDPFARSTSYAATRVGPMFRIMANTVALAMQLKTGQKTTLVQDLDATIAELGLSAPPADTYDRALRGELA